MFDWACFFEPMRSGHVHGVSVSVPYQFYSSEGVIPSEVASADAWPMSRKVAIKPAESAPATSGAM